MVATVAVFVEVGPNATPVPQDTSGLGPPNIRFKTADDFVIDANNPIPIPTSGTNRSFWKHIFLQATGGTFTQIDNVKFFTDGTGFPTGITVFIGDETPVKNSGSTAGYDQATGTVGTNGDELTTHTQISGKLEAFGNFTSGTPKTVPISESGAIINASGETTNYIVAQMDVASTASPGDLADETWTFQYDEI